MSFEERELQEFERWSTDWNGDPIIEWDSEAHERWLEKWAPDCPIGYPQRVPHALGYAPRVREAFARLDAGKIDVFELDDLIHRYRRSARELWKFCGQSGSGWLAAARTLEYLREQGQELPDWWRAGEPRRAR